MQGTRVITNARLVTPLNLIDDGAIRIENGLIADYGPKGSVAVPAGAEVIDAKGKYVGPGFIDIHCHGGGGIWAWDDPYKFTCTHLKFGTTGVLATLSYNRSKEEWVQDVRNVIEVGRRPYSAALLGLHMEGPYINRKYGAITSPIRPVDPQEYRALLALGGEHIKLWTLAPELEGQTAFAEEAFKRGIVMSVGHSEATAEQIFALVPKGLRVGCHCMDATGTTPSPTRFKGTREVGVDEAVLVHDDIYAEVIPDAVGWHVRPLMCRLIHKAKGTHRVIIITDAIDEAGLPENVAPGASDVRIVEGVGLSGSKMTMDMAVRNMMAHAGVGIVEAFVMASLNPAKLLKVDHLMGSIDRGKRANLVIVSDRIEIDTVIFQGEVVR